MTTLVQRDHLIRRRVDAWNNEHTPYIRGVRFKQSSDQSSDEQKKQTFADYTRAYRATRTFSLSM